MKLIFSPAIALLNRMSYTRKFTLLWLMSLVAVAIVVYSLFVSLDRVIQPSQRELEGLVLIEPVSRAVQVIQQHRGISVALLGGNESMTDRRAAKETSVAAAFRAMEEALPAGLTSGEDFRLLKAGWERLRKEGIHWTADENFAAHTRLVEQLQSLKSSIADDYALTLDGELATLYLIDTNVNRLPHVLEHLGQLRAYGTGILAGKQITGRQEIKLNSLIAELDSSLDELETSVEKTVRHNPAVRDPLLDAYGGIAGSARKLAGLVKADILTGRFATAPEVFLDLATAEIDRGYAQMYESLLPTTRTLIERRIARAKNTLLTSVGGALLLFLLVVYVSVSIYYAIIGSIQSLIRSAHTFAEGDLDVRVKLDTRDEISHIGNSFNRMADGFNALLEERKRAEDALQKSKDLLQSVVENAPVHIFWKDRNSRYLGCNTQFAKAAGYASPDEVTGKTDFEMGWKDLAELYRADDKAVMESGTAKLDYEEPGTTPDGNAIWARTSKVPLRGESNQVIGILGIYEDITERKRAEMMLREAEEKFSLAFHSSPAMIALATLDGKHVDVNKAYADFLGYPREEIIGKSVVELHVISEEGRQKMLELARKGGGSVHNAEIEVQLRNGRLCHLLFSLETISIGGVPHNLATLLDITERKLAEQALMESRQRAQHYLDIAGVMLIALDAQGRVQMVNRKGCEMLGHSEADILGKDWFENYLPEPERKKVEEIFAHLMNGDIASTEYHENEILTKSGDLLTVAWHNSILLDESGKISGVLSSGEDITERKLAEQALMESQGRLNAVIETALDAVVQMDAKGIITGWNVQAEKIFGWPRKEAIGRMMDETIIPIHYREAHKQGLKRFLATGKGAILNSRVELQALHRDGHEFPIEISIVPIKTANQYGFCAFIHDITSRKKSEDLIWKQANFDELTGLPNRHMFYDRLAQEIRKADRTSLSMALLYIDLDRFKEINDTLGHSMGDILLVDAARRISACVRETDTVARLGGDEFIVVLTELNEVSRIDALTQDILHELAKPFRLGSEAAYITASIGITLFPHDAAGLEELVKNADQAMYAAKNAGRNRFSYFTQTMQQKAQAKLKLTNDLRGALAGRQFEVHYQPIVELATGRIHKAEALIRWQHPERGFVSPAEFIPLAEESGLIVEIGDWVFREAASQAKRWRTLYAAEFQISVNMSPVQFRSASNPCQAWSACLQELDLPGQSMVIEITEGLLLEAEQGVIDKLLRFHETGIQISLDDFGTGYSSLSYLQKFDIDYLKIDQSFTRNLTPGSSSMALSEAIIMMAHRLDMTVIAEGVETEAQRELLANAGCNHGQGFLFSRPVAAEEFDKLLKTNQAATPLA